MMRAMKTLSFTSPTAADGKDMRQLAEAAGSLDVNSEYAYLLIGLHFSLTSVIVRDEGKPVGFMSAYRLPNDPHTLFVWQVGVLPSHRGQKISQRMLAEILDRPENQDLRYVQATVAPDNYASQRIFSALAEERRAKLSEKLLFSEKDFSTPHAPEVLVTVGALST